MRNGYLLTFDAHSGCSDIPDVFNSYKEARRAAADVLRRARRAAADGSGGPVSILTRGRSWEIEEPDNCAMIGDDVGTLDIRDPMTVPCFECGCDFAPDTFPDRGDGRPTTRNIRGTCEDCANPPADDATGDELDGRP